MNEDQQKHFEEGIRKCDELYHQFQEKMKNPDYAKAHELREEAWSYIFSKKNYSPDKALQLITEAARLNPEYESQIQGIKNMIERKAKTGKVNLKKVINNIFLPVLIQQGFELSNADLKSKKWKEGAYFQRKVGNITNTILIGRTQFGHEVGINISKQQENYNPEYFDFRLLGVSRKDFEYLNQNELESVINKLVRIFNENIFVWLEKMK